MQPNSGKEAARDVSAFSFRDLTIPNTTMCLASFIERMFIPDHVEHLSLAGRTHYRAMLKHVLKPETVDSLFGPYLGMQKGKGKLKALPDWPYLDHVRLCDLRSDHVRRLTTSASARGYSHQTIKHIKNTISAVVSHAKRTRMFSGDNPMSEVNLPPEPRRTSHNLTIVETKAILQLMQYPEREIALITITTGMSVSEICALQWKHVNLTRSSIFTEGKLLPPKSILFMRQWDASGLVDVDTKRVKTVIVPDPLVNLLLNLRRHRTIADRDGFLMANHGGEPIRPSSVLLQRLKPIGRTLDMPWLSWQVLKRGHEGLLSELRVILTSDLVSIPSATAN
jgi:hypothetical protein